MNPPGVSAFDAGRVFALTMLLWTGVASSATLEFVDSEGAVLAAFPLQSGDRWCLLWNHSVGGFAVRDCFVYRPPAMMLEYSHQPDFAAGLGHIPGRGIVRGDAHDGYRIESIDAPLKNNQLLLRVGSSTVNHRVEIGEIELSLSALAANRRVVMHVVGE
jgi:hypothetical protein